MGKKGYKNMCTRNSHTLSDDWRQHSEFNGNVR